jgi:endonuclease YncB( thermonuclease family)
MTTFSKRALVLTVAATMVLGACGSAVESIGTTAAPTTTASAAATTTTVDSTTSPPTAAAPTPAAPPSVFPSTTEAPTTEAPNAEATTTEATTTEAVPTEAPTTPPPVTYSVLRVIDGDTIDIHASDGNEFTARLIGIDAPEQDTCEGPLATQTMASLVNGKVVSLTAGGDGEDVDKYGRFLRYVDTDGTDAGLTLIDMGLAKARYDSRDGYGRHDRQDSYVAADNASADYSCPPPTTAAPVTTAPATNSTVPTTTTPRPAPTVVPVPVAPTPKATVPKPAAPKPTVPTRDGCDPNYSGCVPIDSDVDCAGGKGNGPSYVAGPIRVIGVDIYDLDRDSDGIACE